VVERNAAWAPRLHEISGLEIVPMSFPFRPAIRLARRAAFLLAVSAVSGFSAEVAVQCLTEPVGDVEMSTTVAGTVAKIHHGEGAFVEAGTVMLELESRSEQLEMERRTVQVETLKAELDRSERLLQSTSSISQEEVGKKRGEYRVAVLELELTREALAKRRIIAPFAGIVTLLPVEVGEYCQPSRVLVRLVDARQFYCVANIDPAVATGLALQGPVRLRLSEEAKDKGADLTGKIVFISPVVDPASGLLRIKALFSNLDGKVRPGVAGRLLLP
jgi:RND family efflux transporter MFP subunit